MGALVIEAGLKLRQDAEEWCRSDSWTTDSSRQQLLLLR